MKKGIGKLIIIILLILIFLPIISVNSFANNFTNIDDAYTYDYELLPEWQETIDNAPMQAEEFNELNIIDALTLLFQQAKDNALGPFTLFGTLCAVIILVSVVKSLNDSNEKNSIIVFLDSIAAIYIFTVCSSHLIGIMEVVQNALNQGQIYLMGFIPIFAGVLLSCGQIGASAIYSSVFFTVVNIFTNILTTIIMPITRVLMAFYAAGTVDNTIDLTKLATQGAKWLKWILGAIATLFATILSLQTVFAQSADTAAIKAGKFLVGASVPVVGRAVSDALSSVFAGMKVVKGSVGFAAIAFIAAIFLPIIIQCMLYQVSISLSSLIAGATGNVKMQNILDGCVTCIGILLAIILFFCLIVITSTLIMIVIGMGTS